MHVHVLVTADCCCGFITEQEDYQLAIALRDHPWMRAWREIAVARISGEMAVAAELERHLRMEMQSKGL